ncbi:MAG: amidohydrolase family protein [Thaumarchaeota archaeon]|nr:amidohydrolase family protein [Nitrososphaerota archaeon]
MLLKNLSVLYGRDLKYIHSANLPVLGDKFGKLGQKNGKAVDCEGLLLVPGFINMHTHIGDSIAKDVTLAGSVDSKIHPVLGAKQRILRQTKPDHLISFMKNSCHSMIKKGITTFVDFREGGPEGVSLLKQALQEIPIRGIILGRVESYHDKTQIKKNLPLTFDAKKILSQVVKNSDGLGISGANENSDSALQYYSRTKKLRAIHSSETRESMAVSKKITNKTETSRALQLKPHFLVHMTFAGMADLKLAAKKTNGIVICPRANSSLAEGIPNFEAMAKAGCTVGIGTDNVMINSPDMFREMDYLWKTHMGLYQKRIDPKEILKMATVNGGIILGKKIGSILPGFLADGIFFDKHSLDLEPMHNPHASIVHRANETAISAVMIGGKIIHGKL